MKLSRYIYYTELPYRRYFRNPPVDDYSGFYDGQRIVDLLLEGLGQPRGLFPSNIPVVGFSIRASIGKKFLRPGILGLVMSTHWKPGPARVKIILRGPEEAFKIETLVFQLYQIETNTTDIPENYFSQCKHISNYVDYISAMKYQSGIVHFGYNKQVPLELWMLMTGQGKYEKKLITGETLIVDNKF